MTDFINTSASIKVDVVLAEKTKEDEFDIVFGCGWCDTVPEDGKGVLVPKSSQVVSPEPFTQSWYVSLFDDFVNASALENCTNASLRFVSRNSSVGHRFSTVVGYTEHRTFEPLVLLLYPYYIQEVHYGWNRVYTFDALVIVLSALALLWVLYASDFVPYGIRVKGKHVDYRMYWIGQEALFFAFSTAFFCASFLEKAVHAIHVGTLLPQKESTELVTFTFALGGVEAVMILIAFFGRHLVRRRWGGWAVADILFGAASLFLFGAGFWVGPLLIFTRGVYRLAICDRVPLLLQKMGEADEQTQPYSDHPLYVPVPEAADGSAAAPFLSLRL